ncbi:MAG TPA: sugar ABC transporter permease [Thermomicrobiales bacterium]|nr:sugar ABC transporter permease [Thermomicrobiales bacterium]
MDLKPEGALERGLAAQDAYPGRRAQAAALLERENILAYLLLTPAVLTLLIFVAYPFCYGIWLSLTDARIGVAGAFVGIRNFADLLHDPIFRTTAKNTFIYTGATEVFKLSLGIAMALVLNKRFRGQRFARAAMLLPWIAPTVLTALGWKLIFDSLFSPINWALTHHYAIFGGWRPLRDGPSWLGVMPWPMISLIIANVWRGMPFFGISILAGLQTIPDDLYEASAIDGASAWQRFWRITLPLLRPVITVVVLLSTILTFADFQLIKVLTNGGPTNMTQVFATYAYQVGITGGSNIGMGAAISLFMFPLLLIVVVAVLLSLRKE